MLSWRGKLKWWTCEHDEASPRAHQEPVCKRMKIFPLNNDALFSRHTQHRKPLCGHGQVVRIKVTAKLIICSKRTPCVQVCVSQSTAEQHFCMAKQHTTNCTFVAFFIITKQTSKPSLPVSFQLKLITIASAHVWAVLGGEVESSNGFLFVFNLQELPFNLMGYLVIFRIFNRSGNDVGRRNGKSVLDAGPVVLLIVE